jgi:hypothetical protein
MLPYPYLNAQNTKPKWPGGNLAPTAYSADGENIFDANKSV